MDFHCLSLTDAKLLPAAYVLCSIRLTGGARLSLTGRFLTGTRSLVYTGWYSQKVPPGRPGVRACGFGQTVAFYIFSENQSKLKNVSCENDQLSD